MKIKYAKDNKEALRQLKKMRKGDILIFDERPEIKLCNCPVCKALAKIEAMAFYNSEMAKIKHLIYVIMMEESKE